MKGRGRDLERRESAELLRRVLDELVVHGQQRAGVLQVVEDGPGEYLVHLVEPELQRRHHPEIAAAPAQAPEQVLVLIRAGGDELSLRGDFKEQDGFQGFVALIDREHDQSIGYSMWTSAAALAASETSGNCEQQIAKPGSVLAAPPVREVYEVTAVA